ncbi:hypothetical protein EXIGLDRAFT_515287 [Exidia glandulosa HHB12029]|uniref:C2H2-type domain-containing protein n=1 Tax=Exidia glandulosa HHB12029 TaxID=1314781 RepID=A0A165J900_EXIGL|nr:hypothetical protein EXIGLDRAFT_515287 [Exidia glandulosa HHB12029]
MSSTPTSSVCPMCGWEGANEPHLKLHRTRLACINSSQCPFWSRCLSTWKAHRGLHHDERVVIVPGHGKEACELCYRQFRGEDALVEHQTTATLEKYPCGAEGTERYARSWSNALTFYKLL